MKYPEHSVEYNGERNESALQQFIDQAEKSLVQPIVDLGKPHF